MVLFRNLSQKENEAILKFPAYITLLAANSDGILDEKEKNAAIKLSHMKTFTCDPLLEDYYRQADQVFEQNIDLLDRDLPKEINRREAALKKGLYGIERIALKLGAEYCSAMNLSMKAFKDHVSKAHHNIFIDFIFPLPLPDITI